MVNKPFSLGEFERNDSPAREVIKQWVVRKNNGIEAKDNPDPYGPDLMVYKNNDFSFYLEVEIKRVWKGPGFPYPDVQFPERKSKFCFLDRPSIFCMLDMGLNYMLWVTDKVLISSPIQAIPNIHVISSERFFKVDKSLVNFIKL